MALPPWTVELLRRGVQDLARQATDPETTAAIKQQAAKLVEELPRAARDRVDTLLRQAESTAQPLKDAWAQSDLFSGFKPGQSTTEGMPVRLINGSGILMHPKGSGVPFSSAVQAAAVPFLSGDASVVLNIQDRLTSEIAMRFGNDSGEAPSYTAHVAPSLSDALAAIGALGRRGGQLFVPRCDAWRSVGTATDETLTETLAEALQRNSHGVVREFGRMNQDGDVSEIRRALERVESGRGRHSTDTRSTVLVRLAGTSPHADGLPENVLKVVVIPVGTFHRSTSSSTALPSIEEELAGGADLVVLAGGVICGTPSVGVLVGRSELMARMNESRSWQVRSASLAETAMVSAAVAENSQHRSPVQRLLEVSEENLRDRAERLATQISGSSMVQSVRVMNEAAYLIPNPSIQNQDAGVAQDAVQNERVSQAIASRQVVIKVDRTDELADRMLSGAVRILTSKLGDDLAIDLRWMTPDQQSVVAGFFR